MPQLPSWLLKILRFVLKRPSDKTIRTVRALWAAALVAAFVSAHGTYALLPASLAQYDSAAQWALLAIAAPSLWAGLTGWCVAKRSQLKLMQFLTAVALFVLGGWLMRPIVPTEIAVLPQPQAPIAAAATGAVKTVSFDQAVAGTNAPTTAAAPKTAATGAVGFDQAVATSAAQTPARPLDPGFWISLLAWFPLFAGVTGKMVTSKCMRYGEKVTKIRV